MFYKISQTLAKLTDQLGKKNYFCFILFYL